MPPTFGQPPIPFTQPRIGTLHLTTGPLQPSLTRQRWSRRTRSRSRPARRSRRGCSPRAPSARTATSAGAARRARARRQAAEVQHEVQQRLGHVVRLRRAARDADDREAGRGLPVPAEVVGHAHRAGRVVLHRRDAAVGGAGPDRDDRRGLRSQPVDPLVGGDRLAGLRVDADAGPVALAVDLLVRDRALDDQHERIELALLGVVPGLMNSAPFS